jgi:GAF domain-containing protein
MEDNDKTALRRGLLQILDDAMQLDGAAFGKIRVARPDSRTLEIQVHRGFSERFVEAFREITPDDHQPSALAARTRRRITLPDLERQPADDPFVAAARDEGVRAMQATPILAPDGKVIGCLSTCYREPCSVTVSSALVLDHHARRAAELIENLVD